MQIIQRITNAAGALLSRWMHPSPAPDADLLPSLSTEQGNRLVRLAILEALWRNDLYDSGNPLSHRYRATYGLYRHTQGLYNPIGRLVEFHASHLLGGALDPLAGDGTEVPTALPILGVDEQVRAALALVLRTSGFGASKTRMARWGAMLGDAPLRLVDDPFGRSVRIEPFHPRTLAEVSWSESGEELDGYTLIERRPDPSTGELVGYMERCGLVEGGWCVWELYRRRHGAWEPYAWGREDGTTTWAEPLGFVPLWVAQHIDVGADWGMAESELVRVKVHGLDDAGSMLHDHVRRASRGVWAMFGIDRPRRRSQDGTPDDGRILMGNPSGSTYDLEDATGRDEIKTIWGGAGSREGRAQSLVGDLPVGDIAAMLRGRMDVIEDECPELRFERLRTTGVLSGEAQREARKPVETRIRERRTGYDTVIAQALKGALAWGALKARGSLGVQYGAFRGFRVEDYRGQRLEGLTIGDRPVFGSDEFERLALEEARGRTAKALQDGGAPLELAMERAGFSREEIDRAVQEMEQQREQFAASLQGAVQQGENRTPGSDGLTL